MVKTQIIILNSNPHTPISGKKKILAKCTHFPAGSVKTRLSEIPTHVQAEIKF